ncbi:MAG TPA: co-chaperone GroES [Armatimonadota bacterium]|nr:co-chaperone GroES [Armatimonadota bacterium]
MPLRPLSDRVIARVTEAETTSRGGIVLPDTAKEKPQRAEVLAVGPGKTDDDGKITPLDVKAGDVIIYARYGGTEVKIDGEEVVILSERDILAVVSEEK